MLVDTRPSKTGLAWLRHPEFSRTLKIHRAAAESKGCSFYAPDFALRNPQPWWIGEPTGDPTPLPTVAVRARTDPDKPHFLNLHRDVMTHIRGGKFAKAVPAVCTELEFCAPLSAPMFAGAGTATQFAYGFEFAGEGLSGVTPEILFSARAGVLRTMALAGTGRCDGPPLLDDHKECWEHQLVVEHISSQLHAWGVAQVGPTQEKTFGRLKHLQTSIEIKLQREPDFMALVQALHPTAALGGFPRRPALDWLERQEFARGRFGAPFGYVDGDEMCCVVAIRGLQWSAARARLWVGCGVVEGSDAEREWQELQLKREATARSLGITL